MLIGIVEGIAFDESVNRSEIELLSEWMLFHQPYERLHPFNEFFPLITRALEDGKLDEAEREDILWLARKVAGDEFEQRTKGDMQVLHGILQGVIADGVINQAEVAKLRDWTFEHEHLQRIWPFDEVQSLVTSVLSDGVITNEEHAMLMSFMSDFCELKPESAGGLIQHSVMGVCAMCPEINFDGNKFCFTGSSSRLNRSGFEQLIRDLGGIAHPRVVNDLDYLVIGDLGNPCWAYACYGRKVEQAMKLRKEGARLLIVHENDLWDAVEDSR
jgi:hypothetical protein